MVESSKAASGQQVTMTSPSDANRPPHPTTFADVVNAMSSSFRRKANVSGTSAASSTLQAESDLAESKRKAGTTSIKLPSARWETAPWSSDSFPELDGAQIEALWSGDDAQTAETRACVAKAVEEMKLNWDLDPRLLGERSPAARGSAAIVALLSRLVVEGEDGLPKQNRTARDGSAMANVGGEDPGSNEARVASAGSPTHGTSQKLPRAYERHDLLRAIERQDHETILDIRNQNFDLLLDTAPGTTGGAASSSSSMQTPMGYAISLGPKWEGTAIVLTGAMSKFVNSLPDPEEEEDVQLGGGAGGVTAKRRLRDELDPSTMARLRKLRGNLKLAVDHSLATDQTRLLSSYIQVLFMSEGVQFILSSVESLRNSIRSALSRPAESANAISSTATVDPVAESREMVLHFVNSGLRNKNQKSKVASVQDLIDNAVGDLLLMALWTLVKLPRQKTATSQSTKAGMDIEEEWTEALPAYFFARDDRVATQFCNRVEGMERYLSSGDDEHELVGGSTGGGRRQAEWRRAREIKEQLGARTRRFESGERLSVIDAVLKRR